MALGHSPKIVTNGLVFYFDQNNVQKSWKGAPATNLWTVTDLNNWSKSAVVSTLQTLTPFNTPAYSITDDNTSNYESISRSVTIAADSSSYTVSCMIRKTSGGTSARLGFNISFTGGTAIYFNPRFNSDTGVATYGTVIDYGDWWYWYFTGTNNSTNTTFGCSFYPATGVHNGNDDSTATGTAIVGAFMLVAGSTAVRFAEGTRSNTQALLDLTGRNTITATSLTYASNNTFSFDGTDDNTTVNLTGISNFNGLTVSSWFYSNVSTNTCLINSDPFIMHFRGAGFYLRSSDGVTDSGYLAWQTAPSGNVWNMLTGTWDGTTMKLYVNGVKQANELGYTGGSTGLLRNNGNVTVGGYFNVSQPWTNGIISTASIYNRALSAEEVAQNFNALRGRYGI
jgi:hypothetical protein